MRPRRQDAARRRPPSTSDGSTKRKAIGTTLGDTLGDGKATLEIWRSVPTNPNSTRRFAVGASVHSGWRTDCTGNPLGVRRTPSAHPPRPDDWNLTTPRRTELSLVTNNVAKKPGAKNEPLAAAWNDSYRLGMLGKHNSRWNRPARRNLAARNVQSDQTKVDRRVVEIVDQEAERKQRRAVRPNRAESQNKPSTKPKSGSSATPPPNVDAVASEAATAGGEGPMPKQKKTSKADKRPP